MHRYAAQLSKWFEYVPKARVNRRGCGHGRFVTCVAVALQGNLLVVFAEELHASPQAVVNTITSFLGLPSYDVSSFDVNFVRDLYVLCPCGVRIVRLTDTTLLASVHTRYPHFEGSSGWRAESRYSLPIHPDTEARLREFFRPYNQELQRLLGRYHRVLSLWGLHELRVVRTDCVVCAARIQAFTCSLVDVVGCQVWLAVAEQKHAEYNTRGVVSKPTCTGLLPSAHLYPRNHGLRLTILHIPVSHTALGDEILSSHRRGRRSGAKPSCGAPLAERRALCVRRLHRTTVPQCGQLRTVATDGRRRATHDVQGGFHCSGRARGQGHTVR